MGQQPSQCQQESGCASHHCHGAACQNLPCENTYADVVQRVRARSEGDAVSKPKKAHSTAAHGLQHPPRYTEKQIELTIERMPWSSTQRRSPPNKHADAHCEDRSDGGPDNIQLVESSALELPTPRGTSWEDVTLSPSPKKKEANDNDLHGDYVGDLVDGKPHGYGQIALPDGRMYSGQWVAGKLSGMGHMAWPDGTSYTGQYENNCRNGVGVFKSAEGVIYNGQFADDKMDGQGVCGFKDGREYDGEWQRGFINGKGKMTWSNGCSYVGSYYQGRKHGDGLFTWPDGRTHQGLWRDGKKEGAGVTTDNEGNATHGEWKNGRLLVAGTDNEDSRSVNVLAEPDVEIKSASEFCRPSDSESLLRNISTRSPR